MNTRQMLEKRAQLVKQLRDAQDAADTTNNGSMTDEQSAAFDKIKAALAELEEAMQRRALIEEHERRANGAPIATADRLHERARHEFSIVRAMAAAAGLNVDAGREKEISQEIVRRSGRTFEGIAVPIEALRRPVERRDVITTTTPAAGPGGALIATLVDGSQYIDPLRAALVVRQAGARVLQGLTSNVDIPRMSRSASVGWAAENQPVPFTDEAFDRVGLRPKHAGGIVELSRNMLQQSSLDIEQLVRADLAAVLARALDSAALFGTGTQNDPVGILHTPNVPILPLGTNGAPITYDSIADVMGLPMSANADGSNMAFIGNFKMRQHIAKMLNLQGQPLGFDTIFEGAPQYWTNLVPANLTKGTGTNLSALIFGNWSDLLIGFWSELDILVNPFADGPYQKGNVWVRAMITCDIAIRHPESFAAIVDIDTTKPATVTPS